MQWALRLNTAKCLKMNRLFFIIVLLLSLPVLSQERKSFLGKVVSGEMVIEDVFVINKGTGEETKTNSKGEFLILAKNGDKLVVYGTKTDVREFAINDLSFKEQPYVVSVEIKGYELQEVVVEGSTVTSESLGLVPKDQKRYTPAERKLYNAGDFKPVMLLGLIAGSMPLDPVINAINGRTKRLKKLVALEKQEKLLVETGDLYTVDEIMNELKIPNEHINGFLYFVAENKEFAEYVNAKNETMAKFFMTGLAPKYLLLIKDE